MECGLLAPLQPESQRQNSAGTSLDADRGNGAATSRSPSRTRSTCLTSRLPTIQRSALKKCRTPTSGRQLGNDSEMV